MKEDAGIRVDDANGDKLSDKSTRVEAGRRRGIEGGLWRSRRSRRKRLFLITSD